MSRSCKFLPVLLVASLGATMACTPKERTFDNPHDPDSDSSFNSGDPAGASSPSGERSTSDPHIIVTDTTTISIPLAANEEPVTVVEWKAGVGVMMPTFLSSANMNSSGELWLTKTQVKDRNSGKYYYPFLRISNLGEPSVSASALLTADQLPESLTMITAVVEFNGTMLAMWRGDLVELDENGDLGQRLASSRGYGDLFPTDSNRIAFLGDKFCFIDFDAASPLKCLDEPSSNSLRISSGTTSAVQFGGMILRIYGSGSGNSYENIIVAYNQSAVQQRTYTVSKLLVAADDFKNSKLVTDGDTLYLVFQKAGDLVIKTIGLVD